MILRNARDDGRSMASIPGWLGGLDGDIEHRGRAADAGVLEPQRAVRGLSIAGSAEIHADAPQRFLGRLRSERSPYFRAVVGDRIDSGWRIPGIRRVIPQQAIINGDKSDRGLILIGANTRAGVVRRGENSARDDQVVRAARAKSAKVPRAAVVRQVEVTGGSRAERQQMFGCHRRVAAVIPRPRPRDQLAAERMFPHPGGAGPQIARRAGHEDRVVVNHCRSAQRHIRPKRGAASRLIGPHPLRLVAKRVARDAARFHQYVPLVGIAEPRAKNLVVHRP